MNDIQKPTISYYLFHMIFFRPIWSGYIISTIARSASKETNRKQFEHDNKDVQKICAKCSAGHKKHKFTQKIVEDFQVVDRLLYVQEVLSNSYSDSRYKSDQDFSEKQLYGRIGRIFT